MKSTNLFLVILLALLTVTGPAAARSMVFKRPTVESIKPSDIIETGASKKGLGTKKYELKAESDEALDVEDFEDAIEDPEEESEELEEIERITFPDDENDEKDITLNFENTDLSNFINYMGELKKLNMVPAKETKGVKISLNTRTKLSQKQAWEVFQTVLDASGFAITRSGDLYKIVKRDTKRFEPLPVYINVPAEDLPTTDETIRFVTFLKNITASEVEPLIKNMLGPGSGIIRQDSINGFIITERSNVIKSAMKVVNQLDQSGIQEVPYVIRLKRADAGEVKKVLDSLMKQPEGNPIARLLGRAPDESAEYFDTSTRIIVEERTNSLIMLGNKKAIKKIEEFIGTYFDETTLNLESPIHIYELQYADADQVKRIIEEVVNASSDSGADRHGGVRGGGKFFKKMRFEVDKTGNRLLVSSVDKQDWKLLKETIKDLDRPQPQVAIETLIVDIDIDDTKKLGAQLRGQHEGQAFKNMNWQTGMVSGINMKDGNGNNLSPLSLLGDFGNLLTGLATRGNSVISLGKIAGGVWGLFRAMETQTNTSVVSNPFVTVTNRVTGKVAVGESRQVQKGDYTPSYGGSVAEYETASAKTEIEFTPQINSDGLINLDIRAIIDEFKESASETSNKEIKTSAVVADGQVLVLGGFVKTKAVEGQYNAPVVSKIPVLGWLFKDKSRTNTKTYTFLFVSPTIVKPREKPGTELYTRMKLHRAADTIEESVETKWGKDIVQNFFFNPDKENYEHKVVDFATARYQPTTVDLKNDPYYRSQTKKEALLDEEKASNRKFGSAFDPEGIMTVVEHRAEKLRPSGPAEGMKKLKRRSKKRKALRKTLGDTLTEKEDLRAEAGKEALKMVLEPKKDIIHETAKSSRSADRKRDKLRKFLAAREESQEASEAKKDKYMNKKATLKELLDSDALSQGTGETKKDALKRTLLSNTNEPIKKVASSKPADSRLVRGRIRKGDFKKFIDPAVTQTANSAPTTVT
ncbi:hypothetical protein HOD08_03465 [bacterium]|nr:hypothetical protein [bacterium]